MAHCGGFSSLEDTAEYAGDLDFDVLLLLVFGLAWRKGFLSSSCLCSTSTSFAVLRGAFPVPRSSVLDAR